MPDFGTKGNLILGAFALVVGLWLAFVVVRALLPADLLRRLLTSEEIAEKPPAAKLHPRKPPQPTPDMPPLQPATLEHPDPGPAPPSPSDALPEAAWANLAAINRVRPGAPETQADRLKRMTEVFLGIVGGLSIEGRDDTAYGHARTKVLASVGSGQFERAQALPEAASAKDAMLGRRNPARLSGVLSEASSTRAMIGDLKSTQLQPADSLRFYREAVALVPTDNPGLLLHTLDRWGQAAIEAGDPATAMAPLQRALELREAALRPGHRETMASRDRLIGLYIELGDLAAAEELAHRSQSVEQDGMETHWGQELTKRFSQIAKAYAKAGKVKEIMGPLITCIERMQQSNSDPNELGAHHRFMGQTAKKLDQLSVAEDQFDRAVEVYRKLYGPKDIKLVPHIDALAFCYFDQRKYADALGSMREAEAIERETYGAFHTQIASRLFSIGRCQHALSDIADAEKSYKQGVEMCETISGGNHADVATGLSLLGALYMGTGRPAEAVPVVERAVGIIEFAYGLDHPHMVPCLSLLGDVYRQVGRVQDADKIEHRARDIATVHSVKMAPAA